MIGIWGAVGTMVNEHFKKKKSRNHDLTDQFVEYFNNWRAAMLVLVIMAV